jgi:translation initiation factor IF-1
MAKEEALRFEGVVTDVRPNATFKINVQNNNSVITVLGYISGKMRQHEIRISQGDRVELEISPYDLGKGRIIRRL